MNTNQYETQVQVLQSCANNQHRHKKCNRGKTGNIAAKKSSTESTTRNTPRIEVGRRITKRMCAWKLQNQQQNPTDVHTRGSPTARNIAHSRPATVFNVKCYVNHTAQTSKHSATQNQGWNQNVRKSIMPLQHCDSQWTCNIEELVTEPRARTACLLPLGRTEMRYLCQFHIGNTPQQ